MDKFLILEKEEKPDKENEPFNVLEVQHYQTLIHKNVVRLFPDLEYFDPDSQNENNGHYDTQEVGIMDFLMVNENDNFVVIELKRKASDQTLGQLLRYMGWVKENLCEKKQDVFGMVLSDSSDIYLEYALKCVNRVQYKKLRLDISIE